MINKIKELIIYVHYAIAGNFMGQLFGESELLALGVTDTNSITIVVLFIYFYLRKNYIGDVFRMISSLFVLLSRLKIFFN